MKMHKHNAGHMTKLAACPYMVKHFKNLLPRNHLTNFDEICLKHQIPKPFMFCSNYDPGLTLTFFYGN